jgi:dihydropteroate synthase
MNNTGMSPAFAQGFSSSARLYLRPLAITGANDASADALPLAGGPLRFSAVEIVVRDEGEIHRDIIESSAVFDWAATVDRADEINTLLVRLTSARSAIAGLNFDQPHVMGILNVTPDSFHDGGLDASAVDAIQRGLDMIGDGAHIIDVGGESTRPGAEPVADAEETARVLPVIAGLADGTVPVSIDSRRAGVMQQALIAGAMIVNDVHALTGQGCLQVVAKGNVPVVLMHGPADPQVMADRTDYADVLLDSYDWLETRIAACEAAGIARRDIIVDPGIGFAKTAAQSAAVIGGIALFHGLGCPVMLGASRKSFIAGVSGNEPSDQRLAGSIAAVAFALSQGVQIFRVHDVADTCQAIAVWQAMQGGPDQAV